METKPNYQPKDYRSVTPYLIVKGAARAIDFYKKIFGATERMRMDGPNGAVGHAELQIGDSMIMLADEMVAMGAHAPASGVPPSVTVHIYVPDVDAVAAAAKAAGATMVRPVDNKFYGDRSGTFIDPFGHQWSVATHLEDVTPDEMKRRAEAFMKK